VTRPSPSRLDEISTRWAALGDPAQFALRYAHAIHQYLRALLGDAHEAEEVAQEFLLRGLGRGFAPAEPLRGRFRNYLIAAVRNAAVTHLRRRRPARGSVRLEHVPDPAVHDSAQREWLAGWRRCLLDRAWQALDHHQRTSPGNLFHVALRLATDHPAEDSAALAARASALAGRSVRADAFRKQLSRARRKFAELLAEEVGQGLEDPSPERVAEELAELGLLAHVRDYLPPPGSLS
jgi:RNA polymerase sigma-70 factor (ECF subfamily)